MMRIFTLVFNGFYHERQTLNERVLLARLPRRMVTCSLVLPNIHCNIWIHRPLLLYNEPTIAVTSVHSSVMAV